MGRQGMLRLARLPESLESWISAGSAAPSQLQSGRIALLP